MRWSWYSRGGERDAESAVTTGNVSGDDDPVEHTQPPDMALRLMPTKPGQRLSQRAYQLSRIISAAIQRANSRTRIGIALRIGILGWDGLDACGEGGASHRLAQRRAGWLSLVAFVQVLPLAARHRMDALCRLPQPITGVYREIGHEPGTAVPARRCRCGFGVYRETDASGDDLIGHKTEVC